VATVAADLTTENRLIVVMSRLAWNLWVPDIRFTLGDLRVLMDQPTESIPSRNPSAWQDDMWFGGPERWRLPQGAVRAVAVAMVGILGQYSLQLPAPEDEHPVQHLPPNSADPSAHPRPGRGGTPARSGPTGSVPEQHRHGEGWPRRCWPGSCSRAGPAHRGRGVPPGRVLPGQPQHQSPDLQRHAWTTRPVWVAPAAPDQVAMPAQQRGRLHEPPPPDWARQHPRKARPAPRGRPSPCGVGATCRRSTATSCCNTSSSALLVAERRVSSTSHPSS
jgi:hypothetical protein